MGIAFGSINTGLPKDIVQQIMKAERIPIEKFKARQTKINNKIELVDQLSAIVKELQAELLANSSKRNFRVLKATYNDQIIDVIIDQEMADVGEYQLEVDKLARKSSAYTSGFENPDDSYVGVGYIQYDLPSGETRDIYVDSSNASLRGVADLINADPESGMRAIVVDDGSGSDAPWRLVISLKKTGDLERADFPYFYFVDGDDDFYLDMERKAEDAVLNLDGFPIELPNNKSNQFIPGLSIDLKKAVPGEEFTLKIEEDREAMSAKVTFMIEKMNDVLMFINQQNQLTSESDTTNTLGGDISIQTIESKLRSIIFKPFYTPNGTVMPRDLGVTFQRDGTVKFDEKKFTSELAKDFDQVSHAMVGFVDQDEEVTYDGFIQDLLQITKDVLNSPVGTLYLRKQGLQTQLKQIDRSIENRERMLVRKEQSLKDKFARLEGVISKYRNQGAGLSALGANAPNPVTQLG